MKTTFLLLLGGVLLVSCNSNSEKSTAKQETALHEEHADDKNSLDIELNNGEKWLANEEMKPFVFKGADLVTTYLQNDQTDHTTLAKQVSEQNNQLIKSCTMKGKSHDELHKWLNSHVMMTKSLEAEEDSAKAKETVLQLRNSYDVYGQYFK